MRSAIHRMLFESLEQRLLLSDTPLTPPTYTAEINYDAGLSAGMDVTLEVISDAGTPVLRLWDNALGPERGRQILDENIRVTITGSEDTLLTGTSLSDMLRIDLGHTGGLSTPFPSWWNSTAATIFRARRC